MHVHMSAKIIINTKTFSSSNLCQNGKYLKSIADDSKIAFNKVIYVMDIVSTDVTSIYHQMLRVYANKF